MITVGLVADVDPTGVFVTMPGSRGVLRGPFRTCDFTVEAGDQVLIVTTDDGDHVVVGAIQDPFS